MSTARATTASTPPSPHFDDLHRPEAVQVANSHIFPSLSSLTWFLRVNRAELLEAGAIVELAGRTLLRGSAFIAKALDIGARRAAARTARDATSLAG